jgi:hypothetical protein
MHEQSAPAITPEFREVFLSREDQQGMIFVSSEEFPTLFIAVADEASVRAAIDTCLTNALKNNQRDVQVFTNGSVAGPVIHTVIKFLK